MQWKKLFLDGYRRIPQELKEILEGLSTTDLGWQPHLECNSLGWTVWHLSRVQDTQIADLMGKDQIYIQDKWYARFKRPADPQDSGFGDTPKDVASFRSPEVSVLLGYIEVTTRQTEDYINQLAPTELDRVLNEPWFQPLPTVGVRLVSILADGHQHTGEASYIRGLHQAIANQKIPKNQG
jgi:hypothetical protein